MKKGILSIGLAALLAASLIACAGTPVDPPIQSDASSSQTETQAATAHTTEQTQTAAVTDCTEPAGTESAEQCQCHAESTQTSTAQSTAQSTQASTAESQTDDEAPKYTRIMDENGHCLSVVTNDRAENIELWKAPDDPAIRLDIDESWDGTVAFSYFTDAKGWRLDWVDAADGTLLYRYDQEGYCRTYPHMDGSDKARGKLTLFVQSGWVYISLTREADGSVTESEYSTPYPSLYDRIMDGIRQHGGSL